MYTKKRKFTKTFFPGIFRSRRRAEYFGKKGEVVSFIVLSILIAVGSLLLLKTSGITGAAVDGGNLGVQITVIGTCQDLATGGEYYRLSADVSSGNTCFNILDDGITLDCEGHSITYATADPGYAINNSGGYNGITIKDCMIIERGSASDEYAIYFYNSYNGMIINNNITVSRQGSHGIFLSSSSNNTVSFNNVTSTTLDPFPIFLNGTSDNNLIYNPNLTISAGGTSIRDDSSGTNTLIFNNSFGQINWTKTNLTTKINLAIPDTIFLQGNLLGLIDDTNTLNLNSSAQIIMRALTYISTPYLLKSGIRCDNTNICNISYDPVSRFLYANISSFSNYTTTAEEDPPSVTITNPLNNSNISGIQIFNATVTDPSGVDTVIFMFTDDAYNQTASNVSDNWNTSVDTNGGTFSDGAHNVTVFANDTLNNVNNTETIIVNIDNTFPLFSNPLNTSLNFKRYQNFTANITITDNFIGLNSFIFSTNNSGAWVNDSAISIFGLEYNATISKNISLAKNNQICWYYWANDNVNNNDSSTTYCFTVINTIPTHSTPILNSTDPATNDTYQNLTAYNQSTSDIDEDTVKNIYNWKVNGTAIAVLNMPFEGINGTTTNNTWDYSGYGNNGTVYGGVTWNATGGYDSKGAYEFYTMGDYITVPNINLNASNNDFSVFVWSKIGQHDLHKTIVHKRGSFLIKHHNNAGGGITCRIINNTGQNNDVNAYGVWTDYNWHFIGCEFKNNDSIEVYLDGSLVNSGTFAGTHNVTENNITISDSDSSYFNGTIDEMIIFNRSLSPEQVLALYNNRTNLIVSQETSVGQNWSAEITPNDGTEDGQTLESNGVIIQAVPDTTSPTFSNPVNTSLNYRRYQNFTANITIDDETALGYYIFSTNASGSWANISAVNMGGVAQYNASEQANITLAKNNQICWYYWANDSSNNNATSTTYCFTVQNTAPAFNESLTSQDAYSDQEFNYDINCSDIDGDTITYYDNTTLFAINSTTGFINDTPTQAGVYSINISCSDGEVNTSQTFQYTIHDATIPTFSNAINTSLNFRRYQNFTANITIDDTNLSYYIFSTNSSGSWANISNISMGGVAQYNASEQANISLAKNNQICWYYWANDSSNNNASSTTYCFTVQNSPPAFNQSLTDQNAYSSIEFNYDINCSDIDGDTITYYDNTSLFAINSTTGFINDTPTQAEAGVYSINISCSDGEVNTSQTFQYTIHDSTAPTFSNAINTSLNFSRYQNFTANITINNTNLSTYIFSTNASGSWANTSARDISGNAQ
ncbi:MAG: LamG-like jellyroll fold domain-containing protein, partial [Nanoarchaeota archaeon]